jgi:hypothetical protein
MHRFKISAKMLREDLKPLEDELEDVLHELENCRHFLDGGCLEQREKRVHVEKELTTDELVELACSLKRFEFIIDQVLHFLLHLQLLEEVLAYNFVVDGAELEVPERCLLLARVSFRVPPERRNSS